MGKAQFLRFFDTFASLFFRVIFRETFEISRLECFGRIYDICIGKKYICIFFRHCANLLDCNFLRSCRCMRKPIYLIGRKYTF